MTLKNIQPHQLFINESGLYELLLKSTKPLAKIFLEKYTQEIMPEIRSAARSGRTFGRYAHPNVKQENIL